MHACIGKLQVAVALPDDANLGWVAKPQRCQLQDARCVHRVVLVERGPLQGRQQEWNISRKELQELVSVSSPLHHLFTQVSPFCQT